MIKNQKLSVVLAACCCWFSVLRALKLSRRAKKGADIFKPGDYVAKPMRTRNQPFTNFAAEAVRMRFS